MRAGRLLHSTMLAIRRGVDLEQPLGLTMDKSFFAVRVSHSIATDGINDTTLAVASSRCACLSFFISFFSSMNFFRPTRLTVPEATAFNDVNSF